MISAVVLTHNDEMTVVKTLESLRWCDEIVIVDDDSTDDTIEIAKEFTNKTFTRSLHDDFASQRNFGLSKAKGDWVLFVDSDEVVTRALAEEISRQARNERFIGYFIRRKDFMWGRELKHGEQGNMKLLRLAKKEAGRWIRSVHEVWEVKGQVGKLNESLLHFPHPSVAQFLKEIDWYSTLNAQHLYKKHVCVYWWQIVGYPLVKFFVNYFLRLGFLDGTAGAVVAITMSMHSFLTRAKLYVLNHKSG